MACYLQLFCAAMFGALLVAWDTNAHPGVIQEGHSYPLINTQSVPKPMNCGLVHAKATHLVLCQILLDQIRGQLQR